MSARTAHVQDGGASGRLVAGITRAQAKVKTIPVFYLLGIAGRCARARCRRNIPSAPSSRLRRDQAGRQRLEYGQMGSSNRAGRRLTPSRSGGHDARRRAGRATLIEWNFVSRQKNGSSRPSRNGGRANEASDRDNASSSPCPKTRRGRQSDVYGPPFRKDNRQEQ